MTEFVASPTMERFMLSDAYVRVLAGPIGGGKSVCCAHELMRWGAEQAPNADGIRKTRFLIVRNTADQLKSTTMKTVHDWFPPGVYGHHKVQDKTTFYRLRLPDNTIMHSEWLYIALDTPDDVRKALSLEATGVWGNESRELHPDVVDGLLMRVNRFPSMKDGGVTRPGAIFDTNMPEEDSWWERQMEDPPKNWSIHKQPPGVLPIDAWREKFREEPPEHLVITSAKGDQYAVNTGHDNYDNLAKDYYVNTGEGKKEDFIRVYLRTMYGRSPHGKPVYEETFQPERHTATETLRPIVSDQYPICIGQDFGREPAAVFLQLTPSGTVICLGEVVAVNMGIEKFIDTKLKPYIAQRFPRNTFYVAPDPAGIQGSQVGEVSPIRTLINAGFSVIPHQRISNDPEIRVQAVEKLLTSSVDTRAGFLIDREHAPMTYAGLNGKYRWKTDKNGNLAGQKPQPVKNQWSHPSEALQYAAQVILSQHSGVGVSSRRTTAHQPRVAAAAGWT
jgi:hypothetical protein